MERILLICDKKDVPLFKGQEGFEIKTFDEFNSLFLKMFSYDFILVADLEERELPHMNYSGADSVMNYLAINGMSRRGIYTKKCLESKVPVVKHAEELMQTQEENNYHLITV